MRAPYKKVAALALGGVLSFSSFAFVVIPAASSAVATAAVRIGVTPDVPAGAQTLGAVPPTQTLSVDVTLNSRDASGLSVLAAAVSTPGNPQYHHYLTTAQFADRFGATTATINSVEQTLAQQGLEIGRPAGNGLSIPVTGSVDAIEQAFSTGLDRYQLADGRTAFSNNSAPLVPGSIAGSVQGIIGLDNLVQAQHAVISAVPSNATGDSVDAGTVATGGAQACTNSDNFSASRFHRTSGVETDAAYGYDQLASAYGLSPLYNEGDFGQGVTVALVEFEADVTDFSTFAACYNIDTPVNDIAVDGGSSGGNGLETALDIDTIAALAPQASIAVYQAPNSDSTVYDAYSAIISATHPAQVLSSSWGQCEANWEAPLAQSENTLFQEAATEGITIVAASGDQGSEGCNFGNSPGTDPTDLAVGDPASQPYVTAAGGTKLIFPSYPSLANPTESSWNDGSGGAGDGGLSLFWTMPSYQSNASASVGVINPTYSFVANTNSVNRASNPYAYISSSDIGCNTQSPANTTCREVPDVSADASPYSGYAVYWSGQWTQVGGTSAAAPLWAAIAALSDASATCDGATLGFINPALYDIAGSSLHASALNDVTTGNNDMTGAQSGNLFPATTGYDMSTGLGTPHANILGPLLCEESLNGVGNAGIGTEPVVTSLSTTAGALGTNITVNGFNLANATGVQFGSNTGGNVTPSADGQSLTVDVPAAAVGPSTVDVTVTSPSGSSPSNGFDQFTYGAPVVTSVIPSSLTSASNNSTFTIGGSGFAHASAVQFGSVSIPAWNFTSVTDSAITVSTPQQSGIVQVSVTNAAGTSATPFSFSPPVISTVSPNFGPATTTTSGISITGSGFSNVSPTGAVSFGSVPATYTVESDTLIDNVTAPIQSAGLVPITITNSQGTSTLVNSDRFTYFGIPSVSSVTPNTGSTIGGTAVSIVGVGFTQANGVTFGTTPGTQVVVNSDTSISVVAPANAAGASDITVSNPAGSSATSSVDLFTYVTPVLPSIPAPPAGPTDPDPTTTDPVTTTTLPPDPVTPTTVVAPTPTPAATPSVLPAVAPVPAAVTTTAKDSVAKVSSGSSTVSSSDNTVAANGAASATITVHLQLTNGKAATNRHVSLTSSTGNPVIQVVSADTNSSGNATFKVVDKTVEKSKFTAVDTTDNVKISDDATVQFFAMPSLKKSNITTTCPSTTAPASIVVTLRSTNGGVLQGRTITLTKVGAFPGVLTSAVMTSNANGVASFSLTNHSTPTASFTVRDTTDNIDLASTTLTFAAGSTCK